MPGSCPTCGRANEDDARFCAGCGATLGRVCASCGTELTAGAVFCPSCGALVGQSSAAAGPVAVEETRLEPGRATRPAPVAAPAAGPEAMPAADAYGTPVAPGTRPAGAAAPPHVPPPPVVTGPGRGAGGGGRRAWPMVLIIVLVVAAAAAAAVYFFVLRGNSGGHGGPSATPAPTAAATSSSSPTPSPAASGGPNLAAATGAQANLLSTIGADGSVNELTAPLGKQVTQVAWSPDGRLLACIAGSWNHTRLWLADLGAGDVSEVQIASPAVVSYDSVAWLDATHLLVAGFTIRPTYTGDVAELLIYDTSSGAVTGSLQNADGMPLRGLSVSASADGSRVAYVTYTDQKQNQYGMPTAMERLELLDRSAGTVTELGTGKAYFDVNARRFDAPLISPDGQAVIYRSAGSDVGTSYTVVDATGATLMPPKQLNFPAGYAWDPTGQKVVFTGHSLNWTGGGSDPVTFYVFDRSTGGAAAPVARYKGLNIQDVSWSPDGSTIAFAAYDKTHYQTGRIYLMSPSGGTAHELVADALFPAFRPGP